MATIKIGYKHWDWTCDDGCCYTYGIDAKVEVGAFTYNIEALNEEELLKQFIERHYGDVVEIEYQGEVEHEE